MTEYIYWKWTKNQAENIRKSAREKKPDEKKATEKKVTEKKELLYLTVPDAIHTEPNDKRSVCNERISNRYMIIQTPVNPFLKDSNYIHDLEIQDTHLRPKDSNVKKSTAD